MHTYRGRDTRRSRRTRTRGPRRRRRRSAAAWAGAGARGAAAAARAAAPAGPPRRTPPSAAGAPGAGACAPGPPARRSSAAPAGCIVDAERSQIVGADGFPSPLHYVLFLILVSCPVKHRPGVVVPANPIPYAIT